MPLPSLDPGTERALDVAVAALRRAEALVFAAGAGMGVDSGLPDFRGPEGFWRAYPALARLGIRFEAMANPRWFEAKPQLAWAFYGHRMHLYRRTTPHAGFSILKAWGERVRHGAFVFTSNVDGHFQRAGFPEAQVVECHGSLNHLQCTRPGCGGIESPEGLEVRIDEEAFCALDPLPRCRHCGGVKRPNVLMFGDCLFDDTRTRSQAQRFESWLESVEPGARLVVVEMGAGLAVPTVRRWSERLVERRRGVLVRINVREADVPEHQVSVPLGALAALQALEARWRGTGTDAAAGSGGA